MSLEYYRKSHRFRPNLARRNIQRHYPFQPNVVKMWWNRVKNLRFLDLCSTRWLAGFATWSVNQQPCRYPLGKSSTQRIQLYQRYRMVLFTQIADLLPRIAANLQSRLGENLLQVQISRRRRWTHY